MIVDSETTRLSQYLVKLDYFQVHMHVLLTLIEGALQKHEVTTSTMSKKIE